MLIKKKRSQFEGVARHFALVSDNDGITILGFASRPLLAQCLCISFIASTVEGMQEPKKVNCTSEVRQLIAVQDHISISRSCASIITSQLLHLYVAAIIMISNYNDHHDQHHHCWHLCSPLAPSLHTFCGHCTWKEKITPRGKPSQNLLSKQSLSKFFTPSPFPHKP